MFQARGATGELKYGYQVAARLGAWSVDHNGRVEASVLELNTHWLESGGPLSLSLAVGKGKWIWKDVEVIQSAPSLIAKVNGSPSAR